MTPTSLLRNTRTIVIGATVLLAGIAGTATASVTSSDEASRKAAPKGSVTSAAIKNGTIKKADLSKPIKAALAQKGTPGPQGPAGAMGPAGAPGVPGPASLPQVRYTAPAGSVNLVADTEKAVVEQVLPTGTYHVTAHLSLVSGAAGLGSCAILVGGAAKHEAQYTFPAGTNRVPISLSAVFAASPQASPTVACQVPGPGAALQIRVVSVPVTLAP